MGRFCYSISDVEPYQLEGLLYCYRKEAAELRLDLLGELDENELKNIICGNDEVCLICTYRLLPEDDPCYEDDLKRAMTLLTAAIMSGTDYIDLDVSFPATSRDWLMHLALNYCTRLIVSYHNPYGTESTEALEAIARKCFAQGADIAKIVTLVRHPAEAQRVLALYDKFSPETLIAFASGEMGTSSRLDSLEKGAPFCYMAPRRDYDTAEGQLTLFELLGDNICLGRHDVAVIENEAGIKERDWKEAALWLTAGAIAGECAVCSMNPNSRQPARDILEVFYQTCVDAVYIEEGDNCESVTFSVRRSRIIPFSMDIEMDILGPMLLLALKADGISELYGYEKLGKKDKMRVNNFLHVLFALGADLMIEKDIIIIRGSFENRLRGGVCSCYGDEEIAATLCAAALIADGAVTVEGTTPSWNLPIFVT